MENSFLSVSCDPGLLEYTAQQGLIYGVAGMLGDRDLSRFLRMGKVFVSSGRFPIHPSIRCDDLLDFSWSHAVSS